MPDEKLPVIDPEGSTDLGKFSHELWKYMKTTRYPDEEPCVEVNDDATPASIPNRLLLAAIARSQT